MTIICHKEYAGLTIKKVLQNKLKFSRAAITALKQKEMGISVNGEHKTVRYELKEGDELILLTEDTTPSPRIQISQGPIDILYEDEDLIAVNKPAGMAVHPSKKLQDDTLAGRILYHRYPLVFRAAGRLDKDTSGVVISAKSKVVGGKFFHLIKDRKIKKEYLVLCESPLTPPREGEITLSITRDPVSYIKRVCHERREDDKESEIALTHFSLIKSCPPYHLFLASPITGRTHQLRAHFSAMGFPLCGDTLYGNKSEIIPRQALHARRLSFDHPVKGTPLSITAPLHEDFKSALKSAFGEDVTENLR